MAFTKPPIRRDLTEKAFRKWETIIHNAVVAWPEPITFDWVVLRKSLNTCIARLRDAIRSLIQNRWPCDWIASTQWPIVIERLAQLHVTPSPDHPHKVQVAPHHYVGSSGSAYLESRPVNADPYDVLDLAAGKQLTPLAGVDLELDSSMDLPTLAQILTCYAYLAGVQWQGFPKLRLRGGADKTEVTQITDQLQQDYDLVCMRDGADLLLS